MKSVFGKILLAAFFAPWLIGASGCPNAFQEMADPNSDAALFFQAQQEIDIPNFDKALVTIAKATPKGQASRRGRNVAASAYAGRCGLNLIDLASKMTNLGSVTLYNSLLSTFKTVPTASTAPDDCLAAEQNIVAIPAASAQKDDFVFLAFNSFAKIGTTLAKYADLDDNGVVDPAFNACTTMSDAQVAEIGTGLTLALLGIQNSGLTLDATSSFTDLCARLASEAMSPNICLKTTAASFTALELLALRSMIKGNEIGFGTCGGTTGSSAACRCP